MRCNMSIFIRFRPSDFFTNLSPMSHIGIPVLRTLLREDKKHIFYLVLFGAIVSMKLGLVGPGILEKRTKEKYLLFPTDVKLAQSHINRFQEKSSCSEINSMWVFILSYCSYYSCPYWLRSEKHNLHQNLNNLMVAPAQSSLCT